MLDTHLTLLLEFLDLSHHDVPRLLGLAEPLVQSVEGVEHGGPVGRRQPALAVQRSPDLADVVRVSQIAVSDF